MIMGAITGAMVLTAVGEGVKKGVEIAIGTIIL